MPFADGLGIDLTGAAAERASGTLSWSSDLCTAGATLSGGVLMTLADTVGAVCAYLNLPQGADISTVELRQWPALCTSGDPSSSYRPMCSRWRTR
ncbi:PaaI family thioesterase [Streptomyces sp. NPDC086033]|uniref:PaaI family thioesterase n=1 Tax=Streptomyces sp. NPDC086033 TaxID=3365747 RepID=UPI0037D0A686